jgi:N-acetylmuramoyl-L-alanine amidase
VPKVILDPGHGGPSNPPKVGGSSWNNATGPTGLREKVVTLKVAKAAQKAFAGTGVDVTLTRNSDVNLGIVARAKVAKDAKADVFISIHFNAAPLSGPPAQGTETWIGQNPTAKSRKLARLVQAAVVAATGLKDRGVKIGAVSGTINNAHHDSKTAHCLVEISFLDRQPEEEARLKTDDYIARLGASIRDAVMRYLQSENLIAGAQVEAEDAVEAYSAGMDALIQPVIAESAGSALQAHTASQVVPPRSRYVSSRPVPGSDLEVPLIGDRSSNDPFTDIKGQSSVDSPAKVLEGFEALVGEWNTVQAGVLEALARARRSVCRIIVPAGQIDFLGRPSVNGWKGTGFLVGDNLLLTNHHVLNSIEVARVAEAEFGFEVSPDDLLQGRMEGPAQGKRFKLDPQRIFVTSPATADGLDYTFVWIEDTAARENGHIQMVRASFTARRFDPAYIIHHPQGRLKEVSLDDTEVLRIRSTVIHYASDTDFGSSGAPVFDRNGRLIALHHARNDDQPEQLEDGRITHVLNEGIKISAIAIDLENRVRRNADDADMAAIVLQSMTGSDTLTGFFGALGRKPTGSSPVEAVVSVYTGTEQDVDVGFWNIEWMARRYTDQAKIDGVATVIMDLNLDIWCLSEVSPPAVIALVKRLNEKFGETFEYAFSEPDSAPSKQSTAVIWKPRLVKGEKLEWPAPIHSWWNLDSRDKLPFEAVDGKIFNRYPGLFRFSVEGRGSLAPFDFFLVPLHLKAMAEGSKRRRLASLLLARDRGDDQEGTRQRLDHRRGRQRGTGVRGFRRPYKGRNAFDVCR